MFSHRHQVRVRYAETDKMGYVYYGAYAAYFEVGRVEALRSLGFPYKDMEEQGILLPVHDLAVKYHKPAFYDDLLELRTVVPELPGVRIKFLYEVRSSTGAVLTEAATTLVFIDAGTQRPRRAPAALLDSLAPWFK